MFGEKKSFQKFHSLLTNLQAQVKWLWCVSTNPRIILQVEFPVLQDRPQLPAPLGTLFYTQVCLVLCLSYFSLTKNFLVPEKFDLATYLQFNRLPLVDRLTSVPLMAAGTISCSNMHLILGRLC